MKSKITSYYTLIESRTHGLPTNLGTSHSSTFWGIRAVLCIGKCGHTWKHLAFQKFQGSSSTGAAMRDLVLRTILLASCCGVASTDNRDSSSFCCCNNCIHERLRASLKLRHLKDAHGSIPDDGLGCFHR